MSSQQAGAHLPRTVELFPGFAAILVASTCIVVLGGWFLDLPDLKNIIPGPANMKANTALCLILASIALWLLRPENNAPLPRRMGLLAAVAVGTIGSVTLGEYVFDWNPGLDELLSRDETPVSSYPGRMAPATATILVLLAISLLFLGTNRLVPSHGLALITSLGSFLILVGYAYGVPAFYRIGMFSSVALHTALLFFAFSTAILVTRPGHGPTSIVFRDTLGGGLVRRLLPFAFIIPLAFGWLRLKAQEAGYFQTEFGVGLFAISSIVVFMFLIWRAGLSLDESDAARSGAQESLRQSEEQLSGIIDSAMDGIITVNDEQRVILFNAAAENMFRCPAADAIGQKLDRFLPERFRSLHADHIKTFGRTNVTRRSMASIGSIFGRRSNGEEFPIEASISQLSTDGKKLYTVILRDITQRKKVEGERERLTTVLNMERGRLNNIVASIPGVVWEAWDQPDEANQQVDFVSDYVETMLGYSVEEWLATPNFWLSIVHPDDREETARQAAEDFAGGKSRSTLEFRWIAKNGTVLWVQSISAVIRNANSEPVGVIGVTIDISERRGLEDELRQSQKMEAVGVLAGGVAHDFNNLLTAINGYSDLVLMKLSPGDPLEGHLKEIREAGDRAAALTSQLLAFSRKQVLKPVVLNLNTLITNIEKMLRRLIKENIELRTLLAADLGNVKADPGQIEQVIMNLVVNARDAMPTGGKLTIETKNVYLDDNYADLHLSTNPGQYVRMTFTDTGKGIDKATQERVFEPFFTTKAIGKGTGLGLSTVHGIVKQSGGNIGVYSEIGHGTTFKIYLPSVREDVQMRKWVDTGEVLSGSETILLVEDEEVVRHLVREILTGYGYTVLEAGDGNAALGICQDHPDKIDLMLSDVIMPRMSGDELRDRMMELCPNIKVLFMSGYTDDSITQSGILDGDAAFIEKPFTPETLGRKVRQILNM